MEKKLQLTNYTSDENFQLEKRRLFESAEWTLLRLNETISEMRSWTRERELLQSDIHRLKVALGYAERMLGDSLVQHQSTVIRHLERTNTEMRAELASLTAALMSAERSVAWTVERKVRSKVAKLSSQVAVEKLQLAREIVYLRSRLSESQVDASMYREITVKLDKYTNEDTQLDSLLVCTGRKLIDTVNRLSCEAIRLIEGHSRTERNAPPAKGFLVKANLTSAAEISELRALRLEKEALSHEAEEKNRKLKALTRIISGLRTKLTVLTTVNEKLREKIRASVAPPFDVHLKPPISENCEEEIEGQLSRLINEQRSLRSQLDMERTTAREALKEFNKSAKTVDRLQMEVLTVKAENTKLKEKNRRLRSPKLNIGKKWEKYFLTILTYTRLKLRKITVKSGNLEIERKNLAKIADELKLKNSALTEKIENKTKNEENFKNKIISLTEKVETLECNLSVTQTNYDKLNVDTEKLQKFTNDVKSKYELKIIEYENLSKILEEREANIENLQKNFNTLTSLASTLKTENEKLQSAIDTANTEKNLSDVKGTSNATTSTSSVPPPLSQVEYASEVKNVLIQSASHRINDGVNSSQPKFDTNSTNPPDKIEPPKDETEASDTTEKTNEVDEPPDSHSGEKIDEKSKSTRCNWTIRSRMQPDASEKILRSLEDTDRQLSSLKYELSDVKREIGSLRRQLETKRFTIRRLEGENAALKGEVVKLRSGIFKLENRSQL